MKPTPMRPLRTLAFALLALAAAAPARAQQKESPTLGLGVDTANFDRSVRPQDDFDRFVNGRWLDRTQIPPDRPSTGSFIELRDAAERAVRQIVEEAAAAPGKGGTNRQKIGDLYATFMDTARIEALGLKPLRPQLSAIARLRKAADLPGAFARNQRWGAGGPFGAYVGADPKASSTNIVQIGQGGLGLPDRDYYLRTDEKFAGIRQNYVGYITQLFTLAGQPDPAGAAKRILALETQIAQKQWDRVRNRDRNATYNKMSVADLKALTPAFDWGAYLLDAGLGKATDVIVRQPDYLKAMNDIITATPVGTWRDYLAFRLLNSFADDLPSAFVRARYALYGRTIEGVEEMRPRWKRGVGEVQDALGEAVGQLYVERYFKPGAKQRMDQLVKQLLTAYAVSIDSLDWMSPATKTAAKAKLAKFTVKIGYPDHWRNYSAMKIKRGDLVGDVLAARAFEYQDMVDRLGKPVDRTRWGMTPQTVNAYYNSTNNEIVFPAAILQPPFFNVAADDAVNYGGIGAVIGHEISHGFDDQGSKSDGDGNLRDWWTPEDLKAFQERTAALVKQYSAYEPIDSMHVNGRLTLGENIGDVSGLAVAYRAYHESLGGKEAPVIDGFTGDQRFFMGWAQVWRTKIRDDALRNQLLTDPHSPGQYRAFVPLTDQDAFFAAWNIKPGDKLYRPPEDRVKIW